jgi:hypothetical protein
MFRRRAFTRHCVGVLADLPGFSAGNWIPNRSATQIAVPKQGQVGYCRRDVWAKYYLPG